MQNRLGTDDTADDANIVQICQNDGGALYLLDAARAVSSNCDSITLRLARPQGYTGPTGPSSPTTTTTTATPGPSVSACVPVPDGQEFRLSIVGANDYLTGRDGGITPIGNEGQELVTTQDYSQAIPFLSAPGREGQITLVSSDGSTLYSDQDLTGSGNGPVYFDDMDAIMNSNFNPVQFCLQPNNTFVVQNLGNDKQDPADDANVVQICSDGVIYLHTEAIAATSGCNTIRLEIAQAPPPPYVPPVGCPASSVRIPDGTQFRIRSSQSNRYLTGLYGGGSPGDGNIATSPNMADGILFYVTPAGTGQVTFNTVSNPPVVDSQFIAAFGSNSGYFYSYPNAAVSQGMGWYALQLCPQSDGTLAVHSNDLNNPTPNDVNTAVICSNTNEKVYLESSNNAARLADLASAGCFPETLVYEFIPPPAPPPLSMNTRPLRVGHVKACVASFAPAPSEPTV